jgi:hypothetical protein
MAAGPGVLVAAWQQDRYARAAALLDAGGNGFNDKPSVTADPRRAGVAYAVWTLEGQAYIARTRDSGSSWSAPRLVERAPPHGGLLSSTIAVLGRRRVLLHTFLAYGPGGFRLEAARSRDGGLSWSAPSLVARLVRRPAKPPARAIPFSGPGAAVAGRAVYQAFVHGRGDIDVVRSADGGRSWSAARAAVRHSRGVFGPALAAAPGGRLALSYYSRGRRGTASFWIAQSADGLSWRRRRLVPPFPLAGAPRSGHAAFLGDYSGLTATADGGFAAAFAVAPPVATGGGRSDVLAAVAPGA